MGKRLFTHVGNSFTQMSGPEEVSSARGGAWDWRGMPRQHRPIQLQGPGRSSTGKAERLITGARNMTPALSAARLARRSPWPRRDLQKLRTGAAEPMSWILRVQVRIYQVCV